MYAHKVKWMVFSKCMTADAQFLCSWPGFFTVECLTKVLEQIWNFQTSQIMNLTYTPLTIKLEYKMILLICY